MINFLDQYKTIIDRYTQKEYYPDITKAKEQFVELTGKLREEDYDYESRMNSFYDWYVFNYNWKNDQKIIDHYLLNNDIAEDFKKSFFNLNYSIFHFSKLDFRKRIVLEDVLHKTKLKISQDDCKLGLLTDDIFVGRTFQYNDKSYLLNGVCVIPREALSSIKKESKRIRKLNDYNSEFDFLTKLQKLKTKSKDYNHISPEKIFTF